MLALDAVHNARCEESDRRVAVAINKLPLDAETVEALEVSEYTPMEDTWRDVRIAISRAERAAEQSHELRKEFVKHLPARMNELLEEQTALENLRTIWCPPPPQQAVHA
jgi:endonuclease III